MQSNLTVEDMEVLRIYANECGYTHWLGHFDGTDRYYMACDEFTVTVIRKFPLYYVSIDTDHWKWHPMPTIEDVKAYTSIYAENFG